MSAQWSWRMRGWCLLTGLLAPVLASAGATAPIASGDLARYRASLHGDPRISLCDVSLTLDLPEGFRVIESYPALARRAAGSRAIGFVPLETLAPGERRDFALTLEAPSHAASGALCGRLRYRRCDDRGRREESPLSSQPVCLDLLVLGATEPGAPAPAQFSAPVVLTDIPCLDHPPLLDGAVTAAEYSGARTFLAGAAGVGSVVIYAYHDADWLYIGFDVDDATFHPLDAVQVAADVDLDRGDPGAADRQYRIERGASASMLEGIGSNSDGQLWQPGLGTVAQMDRREKSSGWTAEMALPFASISASDLGLGGQDERLGLAFAAHSEEGTSASAGYPPGSSLDDATGWAEALLEVCAPAVELVAESGCVSQGTVLEARSAAAITGYDFDFGDGNSQHSSTARAEHHYAAAGVYHARVTACTDLACGNAEVTVTVAEAPVVLVTVDPVGVCAHPDQETVVRLDASASHAVPAGPPLHFRWNTSSPGRLDVTGSSATLTLPPGTGYRGSIAVEATDPAGCATLVSTPIEIALAPRITIAPLVSPVCAGAGASLRVALSAASAGSAGSPSGWHWQTSAGTLADAGAPATTLTLPAGYAGKVTLALSAETSPGGASCTGRAEAAFEVVPVPVLAIARSGPAEAGKPQTFRVEAPGSTVHWTFSDGASADGAEVSHAFALPGLYQVAATATSASGCTGSAALELSIGQTAGAVDFAKTVSPTSAYPGSEVEYRIRIGNGRSALAAITIEDQLPEGFRYRPGTLQRDGSAMAEPAGSERLVFPPFALGSGNTTTLSYRVRIDPAQVPGNYDNRAELDARDDAGLPVHLGQRIATVTVPADAAPAQVADLGVTLAVTSSPGVAPGESTATYNLGWRNLGPDAATDAVIAVTLDRTRLALTDLPAGAAEDGSILHIALGRVELGATGSIAIGVAQMEGADGAVLAAARISATATDPHPQDNSADARFELPGLPAAALALAVELQPSERCRRPQLMLALRSDQTDVRQAMTAVEQFLATAAVLEASWLRADPELGWAPIERLRTRLESTARASTEAIFLDSGMGLALDATAETTAVKLPFDSAHPYFAKNRSRSEPWCRHELHRTVSLTTAGASLAAVAAVLEADPGAARATELLRSAAAGVAWLAELRAASPAGLPARVRIGAAGSTPEWTVDQPGPDPEGIAELVHGIARLAAVARAHPELDAIEPSSRSAALLPVLCADLAAASPTSAVLARHDLAAELRAAGRDVEAGGLSSIQSAAPVTSSGTATLDQALDPLETALRVRDAAAARSAYLELEAHWLEPRLGLYRSAAPGEPIVYRPALLGRVLLDLARLLELAPASERAPILERMSALHERVALEAALVLRAERANPAATRDRLLLGARGELRLSASRDLGELEAPALLERIAIPSRASTHADRDAPAHRLELGPGLEIQSSDCSTGTVETVDRRFVTETGLLAVAGLAAAGRALGSAELEQAAEAHRVTLGLMSGFGVRLGFARGGSGLGAERELLDRHAREAGLERMPAGLLPVWLPFDSGDPAFRETVTDGAPFAVGWDPASFSSRAGTSAIGALITSDADTVRTGFASSRPASRFLARVRMHALAATIEFLATELEAHPTSRAFSPALDAEGHPLGFGHSAGADPRGIAAVLLGALDYRQLIEDGQVVDWARAANIPIARAAVAKLVRTARGEVERDIAAGSAAAGSAAAGSAAAGSADPLAQWYARKALARLADEASPALSTTSSSGATPAAEVSPLAAAALELSLASDDAEAVARYRALCDRFFDARWRLFRPVPVSGSKASAEDTFTLTDLDLGAVLIGLADALPRLTGELRIEAEDRLRRTAEGALGELGLARSQRRRVERGGELFVSSAPVFSHAVKVTIAPPQTADSELLPGDLVDARLRIDNPNAGSRAEQVQLELELPPGVSYVGGSSQLDGKSGPEPAAASSPRFALGALTGGDNHELSLRLVIDPAAVAGLMPIGARLSGRSRPGTGGTEIQSAAVSSTLDVVVQGAITGRVALDLDGDGRVSAAEPGVWGVSLRLDDGSVTETDASGRFTLAPVIPAAYRLKLLDASLPQALTPAGPRELSVRVRPGETSEASFALNPADVVSGTVFRDEDGDGRRGDGEPLVAGAVVETETGQSAITSSGGRYLLRGVPTGSHQLRLAARQPWLEDAGQLRIQPGALPTSPR